MIHPVFKTEYTRILKEIMIFVINTVIFLIFISMCQYLPKICHIADNNLPIILV